MQGSSRHIRREFLTGVPTDAIVAFQKDYAFLSNFEPSVVEFAGKPYPTVEHAYQAAKTNDMAARARIAAKKTPAEAKSEGRKVILRTDWEKMKEGVMRGLIRQKFMKSPSLAEKLLATKNLTLVEGNWWDDVFWGRCTCDTHRGEGENRLGKILMGVRTELRAGRAPKGTTPPPVEVPVEPVAPTAEEQLALKL